MRLIEMYTNEYSTSSGILQSIAFRSRDVQIINDQRSTINNQRSTIKDQPSNKMQLYSSVADLIDQCRTLGCQRPENDNHDGYTCPICLDDSKITENTIHMPCCGQNLGEKCIDEWLSGSTSQGKCPICRSVVLERSGIPPQRVELVMELTNEELGAPVWYYQKLAAEMGFGSFLWDVECVGYEVDQGRPGEGGWLTGWYEETMEAMWRREAEEEEDRYCLEHGEEFRWL